MIQNIVQSVRVLINETRVTCFHVVLSAGSIQFIQHKDINFERTQCHEYSLGSYTT